MKCPSSLVDQALLFGSSTDFVQGAGGNLSCKVKDILWIKASGTRLKDAGSSSIFIPMQLSATKTEVLTTENLQHCCINNPSTDGYRPSIETAIHSLLPHKFVAHVHSLGAISRAISTKAFEYLSMLTIDAEKLFIPYHKPGIPLANAILNQLSNQLHASKNLVILLGNHGLIVASETISEATNLVFQIEQSWNNLPRLIQLEQNPANSWSMLFGPQSLDSKEVELLTGGPLTPDQIVFLGSKPFIYWEEQTDASKVSIKPDGSVWVNSSLGQDAIEIVSSFVHIARISPDSTFTQYLSSSQVFELQNWDAEKWRKAQER